MTLVIKASLLARKAHADQRDLSGEPYMRHLNRVAAMLHDQGELIEAVGFLHDLVEDHPEFRELLVESFPAEVVEAVDVLTHNGSEPNEDYWARIAAHPVARVVKLADVSDNLRADRMLSLRAGDPAKAARLTKKYLRAYEVLSG